VTSCIR